MVHGIGRNFEEKNKYILHLDEKLLIASPVWSEELDEALPYLQEESGPVGCLVMQAGCVKRRK